MPRGSSDSDRPRPGAGAEAPCALCEGRPRMERHPLCRECRSDQFRLLAREGLGAGLFFVSLAMLLYLLGRWYAGWAAGAWGRAATEAGDPALAESDPVRMRLWRKGFNGGTLGYPLA